MGLPCEIVVPDSYESLLDRFVAGEFELAYFGGYSFVAAHELGGAKPLVLRRADQHFVSYYIVSGDSKERGIDMKTAVDLSLPPFVSGMGERVRTEGDALHLSPEVVTSLCMSFHELAKNAAKYGALSTGEGRLAVSWQFDADELELTWVEEGGPKVVAPPAGGVGTSLVKGFVRYELKGEVDLEFRSEGLVGRMRIPKDRMVAA